MVGALIGNVHQAATTLITPIGVVSLTGWPPDDPCLAPERSRVRISWMELVLSFTLYARGYIPLHRPSAEAGPLRQVFRELKLPLSAILGTSVPHNSL